MYAKSKHTISFFLFESRADKSICRLFSSSFSGAFFALSLMKQKMCDETAVNVLTPGTTFQCSVLFFFSFHYIDKVSHFQSISIRHKSIHFTIVND
jgi:hypothetical protein